MASNERGVYQPQEDLASYEDYPEEETRSRLPLMIVIALVVLAAFAGVVWLAYNQGVAHGRAGAPPIVAAPAGPVRTAPSETQTATGTATTPYTGLKVYGEPVPPDEEASGSALAPSPEPMPEIAVAPQPGTQPAPETTATPTPAPAPQIAAAVPEAPAPRVTTTTVTTRARPQAATSAPSPAMPAPSAATHAPAPLAPVETNIPEPRLAAPAPVPAPTPAPAPEAAPPAQVATTTPPPAVAPTHTPPAASTHSDATATSGGAVLQVGSYPSDALAESAWKSFRAKHAGALGGLSRDVKAAPIPGKGTWYRLRIGPFANRAEANAKCAELKAAGAQCLVAAP